MTKRDTLFTGSVARNYDEYFGPIFFEPYARDVSEYVAAAGVHVALEIGCGTGRVTRHLRRALPGSARLVASDISADMVHVAREKVGDNGIDWCVADAQQLPFESASIDLLVCYFSYMIVPDVTRAFAEAHRVLRTGGMLLMATWDKLEHNGASFTFQDIVREYFSGEMPVQYRLPFSMYDPTTIAKHLNASGFLRVESEKSERQTEADSAQQAAAAMITGPLCEEIARRKPACISDIVRNLEAALAKNFGEAPMRAPMSAIITRAWK